MGLVEAVELRACDADCGVQLKIPTTTTLDSMLKQMEWVVVIWDGRRLELCKDCGAKAAKTPVLKKALHNTSVAGKFGPETDCG